MGKKLDIWDKTCIVSTNLIFKKKLRKKPGDYLNLKDMYFQKFNNILASYKQEKPELGIFKENISCKQGGGLF